MISPLLESQFEFTRNLGKLLLFAESKGFQLTVGEAFRTEEQQRIYFKKRLSKTMNSRHRERLAIDMNLFVNGVFQDKKEPYRTLAEYWETLNPKNVAGFTWGWDANHFEMKP